MTSSLLAENDMNSIMLEIKRFLKEMNVLNEEDELLIEEDIVLMNNTKKIEVNSKIRGGSIDTDNTDQTNNNTIEDTKDEEKKAKRDTKKKKAQSKNDEVDNKAKLKEEEAKFNRDITSSKKHFLSEILLRVEECTTKVKKSHKGFLNNQNTNIQIKLKYVT